MTHQDTVLKAPSVFIKKIADKTPSRVIGEKETIGFTLPHSKKILINPLIKINS